MMQSLVFYTANGPLVFLPDGISVRPGSLSTDQDQDGLSGQRVITNSNDSYICDSQRGRKVIFYQTIRIKSCKNTTIKNSQCFWEFKLLTFRKECKTDECISECCWIQLPLSFLDKVKTKT